MEIKEFNLSDKIWNCDDGYHPAEEVIEVQDIKEFIKELRKSRLCRYANDQDIIDKLVGDKLT